MRPEDFPKFDDNETAVKVWLKAHIFAASEARKASINKRNYAQAYRDAQAALGVHLSALARGQRYEAGKDLPELMSIAEWEDLQELAPVEDCTSFYPPQKAETGQQFIRFVLYRGRVYRVIHWQGNETFLDGYVTTMPR